MEAFQALVDGIVAHPTACMLAIALIALGFLYRARESDKTSADARLDKLNEAHKATLEKVIPVADKLGDAAIAVEKAVATLERMMDRKA